MKNYFLLLLAFSPFNYALCSDSENNNFYDDADDFHTAEEQSSSDDDYFDPNVAVKRLKNTWTYQCLKQINSDYVTGETCNFILDLANKGPGYALASFVAMPLIMIPILSAVEKSFGSITLKLMREKVITNYECLGTLLFVEKKLKDLCIDHVVRKATEFSLFTGVGAETTSFVASNATSSARDLEEEARAICRDALCPEQCIEKVLSKENLVCHWYNKTLVFSFITPRKRTLDDGELFLGHQNSTEFFDSKIVEPIIKNHHFFDSVIFGFEGERLSNAVKENSRRYMCQALLDAHIDPTHMRYFDLQNLPAIHNEPEIFSPETNIYSQCDLARVFLQYYAVNPGSIEDEYAALSNFAVYMDLDGRISSLEDVFVQHVAYNLEKFGIVFLENGSGDYSYGFIIMTANFDIDGLVEFPIAWIKKGLAPAGQTIFVADAIYLWWARQFGWTMENLERHSNFLVDASKKLVPYKKLRLLELLDKLDINKFGKAEAVIDLEQIDESLMYRMDQILGKRVLYTESRSAALSILYDLSNALRNYFASSRKPPMSVVDVLPLLPMVEWTVNGETRNIDLMAPRETYH